MAARISSFCQGPRPLGPTKTAQVSDSAKAFSMSGCQGLPGIRCHGERSHFLTAIAPDVYYQAALRLADGVPANPAECEVGALS